MNAYYEQKKLREGYSSVIGCDEVGRGCLAGPVVAAAVCFNFTSNNLDRKLARLINDSKLLTPNVRSVLDVFIRNNSLSYGVGAADVQEVDEMNIHHASMRAMRLAVKNLARALKKKDPESGKHPFLFLDGKFIIKDLSGVVQQPVVDGDAKIFSVAAASIVAKVYRDDLMGKLDRQFPGYGFGIHKGYGGIHKGYGTFRHIAAIKKLGLSPLHRRSFCSKYL
jgi:ribonuclease HII